MSRFPAERLDFEAYNDCGIEILVGFSDMDMGGHLNNTALGRFFETGRFRYHLGLGLRDHWELDASPVVGRISIDYLSEGAFDPLVRVRTWIREIGTSSFREWQIAMQGDRVLGLAEVVMVYRKKGTGPSPIPPLAREILAARIPPAVRPASPVS